MTRVKGNGILRRLIKASTIVVEFGMAMVMNEEEHAHHWRKHDHLRKTVVLVIHGRADVAARLNIQ